jgi:N-acetylglucosamine kinase-like BadF-type ATPase
MLNMAVDGGGSKLLALAFTEDGSIVSVGKGSTVNPNFATKEDVVNTIKECLDGLLSGIEEKPDENGKYSFDHVYVTIAGPTDDFIEILNRKATVKNIVHLSEGAVGQLASSLTGDGLLALSGTGSDCFLNKDSDTYDMIGGWGAAFGDEGSGYWMGCEAIRGALRSYDGRGKKSLLETLIPQQYGYGKNIRKVVKLYRSPNQRKDIASATKSLSRAMWEGDEVAHDIIIQAAELMAEQAITLLKKHDIPKGMKFTVAGGGWKVSNLMIDHFAGLVLNEFPDMEFIYPEFEPVIGGIIHTVLRTHGEITEEKAEDLRQKLQDYQFITDDMRYKQEIIEEAIRLAKMEG